MSVAVGLPEGLGAIAPETLRELVVKANPAAWAELRRGFENAPFHQEWYELVKTGRRVCVVAPREHAKTEVFTVNATAWRSIYNPGLWTYIFSETAEQGYEFKARIDSAIEDVAPELVQRMKSHTLRESIYSNGARVTVAGAGKAVRSTHPDVIIADDVLSEKNTGSKQQRDRLSRWFFGTVSNMAHPGTVRTVRGYGRLVMPPTRIFLVGTPFHEADLLMGMKANPMYVYRRYAAEFHEADRVNGSWAVEVG